MWCRTLGQTTSLLSLLYEYEYDRRGMFDKRPLHMCALSPAVLRKYLTWWWWLQHPSKDDEACAFSGKRTTSNSKLNTSIRCGV